MTDHGHAARVLRAIADALDADPGALVAFHSDFQIDPADVEPRHKRVTVDLVLEHRFALMPIFDRMQTPAMPATDSRAGIVPPPTPLTVTTNRSQSGA